MSFHFFSLTDIKWHLWSEVKWALLVVQLVKNLPAVRETWVWSLGWEDSPGEGNGSPLQCSGMENFMDCIGQGVTKSQTRLRDFHYSGTSDLGTEDEMAGWHHQLNGHEFENAPGALVMDTAWHAVVRGVTKSRTRLSDWTELNWTIMLLISFTSYSYLLCLFVW